MDLYENAVLTENDMKVLLTAQNWDVKSYKKGEIVKNITPRDKRIFLVVEGVVSLQIENALYEKEVIEIYGKGQFFSHAIPYLPGDAIWYICAKKKTRLAAIRPEEFESTRLTSICSNIHFIYQSQTFFLLEHCHILQQKTVRNKIFAWLYFQRECAKRDTIVVEVPYADLAAYLMVDRSSLLRELKKLENEGFIRRKGRCIHLLFGKNSIDRPDMS